MIAGYEVDFWMMDSPIILECDGWSTHGLDRAQFEKDRTRDAELTALGYVVIRFTYRAIITRPRKEAERIRKNVSRWASHLLLGGDLADMRARIPPRSGFGEDPAQMGGGYPAVGLSAMSDRTLVLLKPDAVERGLVGTILARFEAKGLRIVALDQRTLDKETLARHYEEHVGKGFYDDLVTFMSRGPVVALVLEGPEDTWEVVRSMMGATNPRQAAPGTIRGDLGILFTENLVHGSDSAASADREVSIFFPDL